MDICKSLAMRFSHSAKNANELGPAWQNITVKSDIYGQKKNGLEKFSSRRHFEEITQPKTLNQPQNEKLYISKR